MIGNRLKLKRQADRLSLQELSDLLEQYGVSIAKGALSNYETGKVLPGPSTVQVLCQTLGISEDFLSHEEVPLDLRYFSHLDLIPKRQVELDSYVACHIELRLDIDRVLRLQSGWKQPERMTVAAREDLDGIAAFAEQVRKDWGLGDYPISSVTYVLERQGWDIFELPEAFGLSGICGYDALNRVPFLYYPTKAGLVNVRMQMLSLVADAYLDVQNPALHREACRRFATAILLTRTQAETEFGAKRQGIAREELEYAKYHFGLPKYEIMNRLFELGIIEEDLHRAYFSTIRQQGYPSARDSMMEPLFFFENSVSYKQKVRYAMAEGLVSAEDLPSISVLPRIHRG